MFSHHTVVQITLNQACEPGGTVWESTVKEETGYLNSFLISALGMELSTISETVI